ncbi:LysR substrate-binding domain-containing protein [Achromobacter aloeverae]|uniref:LysR family transcriptional regulator n=1 Tax=Achromobacter aloeverae TaxID=1750518 RepID=A0A4Q1HMQ1_9BURK|nr:LysR substrate-binding domain-containing protein [Achromobacter aloeverae]RXN92248.1 LysR family transcriptional regulator [Achromobacter aloeverae]
MTLTQIRTFIAVVQHGGFSAAARSIGASHSTLISQIQMLEREYGAELFHRRGRRVELSAVGLQLLPMARRMLALESEMRLLLDDSGQMRRGSLRVGAVGPYHVTEMIESYHARHPGISLSVKLGNSEVVLDDLDKYVCDVAVVASRAADDRYHMQSYARYPVIAFVRGNHAHAQRESITLDELAGQPLLMRETGSTTRKALEDAMEKRGLTPRVAMEIGSREALREAVARGLGVGTVSQSEYVPDPRLVPLRIEGDLVSTNIHVCCLRERRDSRLIASFFDAVRARSAAGAGGQPAPG